MARVSVQCYKLLKESINKVKFDVNFLEEGAYTLIRYIYFCISIFFMGIAVFHQNVQKYWQIDSFGI